ncbi:hypothetical protein OG394_35050 [Kribbella sp. NBC_01245]|uniref:hypothetical protein n=1 Tax=Kribbella sp. NBC_01245 TaxID=2903578 RepID=UPI002E2E41B4|nr:hypothetical protein [Kribbella sp. NBC_01245]
MNALDDRVKRVMTTEADRLTPTGDLARTAIRRGVRIRRGRRAAGIGIAAVGVVLAVFLPTTILNSSGPDPTASPSPAAPPVVRATQEAPNPGSAAIDQWLAGLPRGPLPRVPYLTSTYLQDGTQRVPFSAVATPNDLWPIGRVPDGWLIGILPSASPDKPQLGRYSVLMQPDRFAELARGELRGAVVSPDGKRIAYAIIPAGGQPRAAVFDVGTRKEVASVGIGRTTRIDGWNAAGIWLSSLPDSAKPMQLSRWIPGKAVQELGIGAVVVPSGRTDRMVQRSGDCDQITTFGERGFSVVAKYCGFGDSGSVLSADGAVFITADGVARTVGFQHQTQLDWLPGVPLGDHAWEDGDQVLLAVDTETRRVLVRCDVHSGKCERALTAPTDSLMFGPSN